MTQILGSATGKTSAGPKEPVVMRKPPQVFFESTALANSATGTYIPLPSGNGGSGTFGEDVGKVDISMITDIATTIVRRFPVAALFYSGKLNDGETEMLQSIRGDQLYHNLIHGQMMIGAYSRLNSTVTRGNYIPAYELREIAQQNGRARTRVRFRIEEDPKTGKWVSRSYEVGEKSGLDRVRVRFAKQVNDNLWQFEDTLSGVTLIWSRDAGKGTFNWGTSQATAHEGRPGGYTTPPTPIPEPQGIWGLPNPAPEPLPPLPGTPLPEEQGPNIETLPIEDRDFNDFIIVDPMGVVPAIYVYFQKAPTGFLETGYYIDFFGRPRDGEYEVDHVPSKAAVRVYLKNKYPMATDAQLDKWVGKVGAVSIPKDVHRDCSETYGGRNRSTNDTENGGKISKKDLDSLDLKAAVDSNWDANAICLKERYHVSDERIEEIRNELHDLNRKAGLYK